MDVVVYITPKNMGFFDFIFNRQVRFFELYLQLNGYINIYTWIMSNIYIHATHAAAQQQSGSLLQINVPTRDALACGSSSCCMCAP